MHFYFCVVLCAGFITQGATIPTYSASQKMLLNKTEVSVPGKDVVLHKDKSPVEKEDAETGTGQKKPRCLSSILGWYAKKKVANAVENFEAPELPDFRTSGSLFGIGDDAEGVVGSSSDIGRPSGTSGSGSGFQSPLTPGFGQAMNALNNAHNLEDQANAANSQLNSPLGLGGFNRPQPHQSDFGFGGSSSPLVFPGFRDFFSSITNGQEQQQQPLSDAFSDDLFNRGIFPLHGTRQRTTVHHHDMSLPLFHLTQKQQPAPFDIDF